MYRTNSLTRLIYPCRNVVLLTLIQSLEGQECFNKNGHILNDKYAIKRIIKKTMKLITAETSINNFIIGRLGNGWK